jgi:hypothetical protein
MRHSKTPNCYEILYINKQIKTSYKCIGISQQIVINCKRIYNNHQLKPISFNDVICSCTVYIP